MARGLQQRKKAKTPLNTHTHTHSHRNTPQYIPQTTHINNNLRKKKNGSEFKCARMRNGSYLEGIGDERGMGGGFRPPIRL